MNIKNLVKAIQIIEQKSKEGLVEQSSDGVNFIFYDEQFFTDRISAKIDTNKDRSSYKRSIGAWISYEMNPNYPNNLAAYGRPGLLIELSEILDVSIHEVRHICVQSSVGKSIRFIRELLDQVPRSELIKHIDG